tara:strand:+ start:8828 stop:9055 length:228 start_codon:yes stop_codon:yes gene_type:complete
MKMTTNERWIDTAEQALMLNEDDRANLKLLTTVDLIVAHLGITDEQIRMAYENRLRQEIKQSASVLSDLASEGEC